MIRSRRLQRVLYFAATYFEGGLWRIFHDCVRRIYLGPVVFILGYLLRPSGVRRKDFTLLARHSATVESDFNGFLSDLDLSVVAEDSTLGQADEIVRRFQRWKERLLFLGELEIYSKSEFDELQDILKKEGDFYAVIRRIRKLSWMEQAAASASSDYHLLKANRSISKILSKEDISFDGPESSYRSQFSKNIKAWLDGSFGEILSEPALSADLKFFEATSLRSDYLATTLIGSTSSNPREGELSLPLAHRSLLLAITPKPEFNQREMGDSINPLRSLPPVREKWRQISRIECLIFQAVIRAQTSVSEADREWLNGFIESWRQAS